MRRTSLVLALVAAVPVATDAAPGRAPAAPAAGGDSRALAAQTFLDGVLRKHQAKDEQLDGSGVFTSELAHLIDLDGKVDEQSGDGPHVIDLDLTCGCNGGYDRLLTSPAAARNGMIAIHVVAVSAGKVQSSRFFLMTDTPQGWRVADIITPGKYGGSLLHSCGPTPKSRSSPKVVIPPLRLGDLFAACRSRFPTSAIHPIKAITRSRTWSCRSTTILSPVWSRARYSVA